MKKDEEPHAAQNETPARGYLFTVEVLIEEKTNSQALEKLLHVLNSGDIKDFRIVKGIEFGKIIAQIQSGNNYKKSDTSIPAQKPGHIAASAQSAKSTIPINKDIVSAFQNFQEKGTLVRLQILKGKGVRLSIPCRILNFDVENNNVSVYHVDEKKPIYSK